MLRILGRTSCILLLAGIVAGGLYLLVGRGDTFGRERRDRPGVASVDERVRHGRGGRWAARSPEGGEFRERGGREEASLAHGLGGMLGTALQVGVVAVGVAWMQNRSRRKRRPAPLGTPGL